MQLISENPYRILGLFGNAKERELHKNLAKIKAYTSTGKEFKMDNDFEVLGNLYRNTELVELASKKIEHAYNKVHHALFWFTNISQYDEIAFNHLREGNIDKAFEIWDKTISSHDINFKNISSVNNLSTLELFIAYQQKKYVQK